MAGDHSSARGDTMHDPTDRPVEPLEIIKWSFRLLYVLLFISSMVVMGQWHTIITYTFLGSALALLFPILFSRKTFESLETDVHKCILERGQKC